jgi:hypothetical protein
VLLASPQIADGALTTKSFGKFKIAEVGSADNRADSFDDQISILHGKPPSFRAFLGAPAPAAGSAVRNPAGAWEGLPAVPETENRVGERVYVPLFLVWSRSSREHPGTKTFHHFRTRIDRRFVSEQTLPALIQFLAFYRPRIDAGVRTLVGEREDTFASGRCPCAGRQRLLQQFPNHVVQRQAPFDRMNFAFRTRSAGRLKAILRLAM